MVIYPTNVKSVPTQATMVLRNLVDEYKKVGVEVINVSDLEKVLDKLQTVR